MEQEQNRQKEKPLLVGGYLFQSEQQGKQAQKELEYISKLKKNLNPEEVDNLYRLYIKLTGKGYFHTPVGFHFLAELREYLTKNGYQLDERPIPVLAGNKKELDYDRHLRRKYDSICEQHEQTKQELEKLKLLRIKLIIAVFALAIVVAGMIFMVVTNDNIGYFNVEEKIQNKYAYWEEQLDEREQELSDWEQELSEQAEKLESGKTQN